MLSSLWQFYLFQCCQLSTTFGRYIFCTVPFISPTSTVCAVHIPVRSQYCHHPHLKNHLGLRQRKGSDLTMPLINLTSIYWVQCKPVNKPIVPSNPEFAVSNHGSYLRPPHSQKINCNTAETSSQSPNLWPLPFWSLIHLAHKLNVISSDQGITWLFMGQSLSVFDWNSRLSSIWHSPHHGSLIPAQLNNSLPYDFLPPWFTLVFPPKMLLIHLHWVICFSFEAIFSLQFSLKFQVKIISTVNCCTLLKGKFIEV